MDDIIKAVAEKVGYEIEYGCDINEWPQTCGYAPEPGPYKCTNCGRRINIPQNDEAIAAACKAWMAEQDDKYIRVDNFVHCLKRILAKRLDDLICDKYALMFATPEDKIQAFYNAFCGGR